MDECCKMGRTQVDCRGFETKRVKVEVFPRNKRLGHASTLSKHGGGGNKVPTATCPECEESVHVETDMEKGDTVSCEECGTELQVVGLDPVELDIVEDEDVDEDEEEY